MPSFWSDRALMAASVNSSQPRFLGGTGVLALTVSVALRSNTPCFAQTSRSCSESTESELCLDFLKDIRAARELTPERLTQAICLADAVVRIHIQG